MGIRSKRTRAIPPLLYAAVLCGMVDTAANAAVTVIGTQYQQDILYAEYNCIYDLATNYPTSCPTVTAGANIHVYLKNTGGSAVTASDVTLAGYSLATVIKEKIQGQNDAYSIYYYWDTPPSDIMNAGEPIWYQVDPNPIPAGGVAQAVIRLRTVPTTATVSIGVVHSEGTTAATVTKDASTPRIASLGFSPDLDKVYIHWRRSGGAGPTTIKVDNVDVTALCNTVSNANLNFAVTTYTPASALGNMSYHVYQGIYSDGKTATISSRSFVNTFSYGTYGAGPTVTQQDGRDWIVNCENRGVNLLIYNNGSDGLVSLLNTSAGQQFAIDHGYGFMIDLPHKWNVSVPRFWYGRDEPDAHDWHLGCGTGLWLPCDKKHHTGNLAMTDILTFASRRANYPTVPSVLNIDCTYGPYNYYVYGQATDVGMSDPYYQSRQASAYWGNTAKIPLWEKAELYIYGTTRVHVAACEPNPVLIALSSTGDTEDLGDGYWPYATPETKRTEAYYAIAAGAKSMGYWWFLGDTGLGTYTDEALALWKEIGLLGNVFRAAQPIIVISHPVDMTLQGSTNVWARALAAGNDTLMLVVINDDHYNDIDGCHYTALSNATLTATLPPWMTSSPYAFEVTAEGVHNVASSLNGSDLTITLGTVDLTRMIIVTTNANLQSTIDQRYKEKCWQGVCAFAPDHCHLPGFTQQPSPVSVGGGGTAVFSVAALGLNISYQWQKDNVNISNGGHYSGVTTATLTITGADDDDAGDYRCVLSNAYYSSIPSDPATLTVECTSTNGLTNGNFDASTSTWTLAEGWTSYSSGTPAYLKDTTTYRSSPNAQKISPPTSGTGAYAGVRQTVTSSVGDAVTFVAWAYAHSNTTYETARLGAQFDGSTTPPSSWQTVATKQTWTQLTVAGTVTVADGATVFLDVIRGSAGTYWSSFDDVSTYYAFVPPPPVLTDGATSTTINVNVEPGCNYNNSNAQYAITIGGGAYTLGTHWVQANGSVSTSAAWQTDTTWGTKTVTGLTSNTTYTFKVQARNNGTYTQPTAQSAGIQGTPHTIIVITQQPEAENICPGQSASFSVSATGEGTVTYQWQKNQANINNGGHYSGCTTATLTITGADTNDAASYRCRVSDIGGSVYSDEASLMVKEATVISSHPAAQNVCAGEYIELYVTASGEGTLTYQWQKNSANISDGGHYSGCNSDVLAIADADANDAANYRCKVTGGCGSAIYSNQAAVTIKTATAITGQSSAQDVCPGANASFSVTAAGAGTIAYQWQKNSANVNNGGHYSGCTTATLTITGADTNDVANYRCVISADCGSATSNQAALTLSSATSITAHPTAQNVCPGSSTNFTVTATGSGTLTYQWQKNSANISNGGHYSGCTTATLAISTADTNDAANYRCKVTGTCGSATSNQAALTIKTATSITSQPTAQSICAGSNASFIVAGTGDGTLTYQWQKNQTNISDGGHYSGCTTATLAITGADTNDAANYRCTVTGGCGSVNSNEAALTIKAATSITSHPSDQTVVSGNTAIFTVAATGDGSPSYQWQKNGANLNNGGHYSGCTTATLTISTTDTNDEADYRCRLTATCGSETSNQASLTVMTCNTDTLVNGNFEDWPSGLIAPNWTGAYSATVAAQFARSTSPVYAGSYAQKIKSKDTIGSWCHVYQGFSTNVGDALTITGYLYSYSTSSYTNPRIGVNTSSSRPDSWLYSLTSFTKQTWVSTGQITCNASGTTTYVFLETDRATSAGDTSLYLDNFVVYRAQITPSPAVAWASSSSLNVNVDPGCNSGNANAQYAITISGGGYTEGTHWVQANGTVSTSAVWQTDATWGNKTVTGLSQGTTYTFRTVARYNGTYTHPTELGGGAQGTP